MARSGITQAQVDATADALLLAGERPTIERVRAHLGTGAPATVIRLLEVWWRALGQRLQAQTLKVAMPEAPADVAAAASQLWCLALTEAQALAGRELESAHAELDTARSELSLERQVLEQRVHASEIAAAEADRLRQASEVRLGDLQRLLDQQTLQIQALQAECKNADAKLSELQEALQSALTDHSAAEKRAAVERASMEDAHRAAEGRWLREVDRARQESERLGVSLHELELQSSAAQSDTAAKLATAVAALHRAERDEAVMAARIATLEAEVTRLHAQLRDAIGNSRSMQSGSTR